MIHTHPCAGHCGIDVVCCCAEPQVDPKGLCFECFLMRNMLANYYSRILEEQIASEIRGQLYPANRVRQSEGQSRSEAPTTAASQSTEGIH